MERKLIQQSPGVMVDIASESVESLQYVADHCKELRETGDTGSKDMRLLGVVPRFMIEMYCNDNGVTFQEFMRNPEIQTRMLNDPALSAFRVHEGRV